MDFLQAPIANLEKMARRLAKHLLYPSLAVILIALLTPDGLFGRWDPSYLLYRILGSWRATDVVQNVLLFLPFGFWVCLRQTECGVLVSAVRTVLLAFGLSAACEAAQLLIPGRFASIQDVLMNLLGGSIGACVAVVYQLLGPAMVPPRGKVRLARFGPALRYFEPLTGQWRA